MQWCRLLGVRFFYLRPVLLDPPSDRSLIPLLCAPLGLLRAPSKRMKKTTDMIWVVLNPKPLLDQLGDSWARPQIGRKAARNWPFHQKFNQLLCSCATEPRRPARSSLRLNLRSPTQRGHEFERMRTAARGNADSDSSERGHFGGFVVMVSAIARAGVRDRRNRVDTWV